MQRFVTPDLQRPVLLAAPPLIIDGLPSKLYRLRPFNFLGSGSFGNVFSVKDPSDGCNYALKAIRIPKGIRALVVQEVTILSKLLHHENIVKITGAWPETIQDAEHYTNFVGLGDLNESLSSSVSSGCSSDKKSSFSEFSCPPDSYLSHSERDVMFIKMELCQISLQEELKSDKYLSPEDRMAKGIQIFRQLLSVLKYLVRVGILHNDIRPENILFKGGVLKLADFGLSCILKGRDEVKCEEIDYEEVAKVRCNPYKSPELTWFGARSPEVGGMSDVFSVGAVMFRILSSGEDSGNVGHLLDGEDKVRELFMGLRIQYGESHWDLLDIVEGMVARFPEDRVRVTRDNGKLLPFFGEFLQTKESELEEGCSDADYGV